MKYLTRIQKNIVGFKPEIHWKLMVAATFFLVIASGVYDVYLYIYATRQTEKTIHAVATSTHATSTVNLNMEELFSAYRDRQTLYTGIIQTLSNSKVTATLKASTTATSSVATSSKQ